MNERVQRLVVEIRNIHDRIRDQVVAATERQHIDQLSGIDREEAEDTIYAIDVVSESQLLSLFEDLSRRHSFVLVAEGVRTGWMAFPPGASEADAEGR